MKRRPRATASFLPRDRHQERPAQAADPLTRCHERWVNLFYGVLTAIWRHDQTLFLGLEAAFLDAGLSQWQGDSPSFRSDLMSINPSDEALALSRTFRARARIPPLRGRVNTGRLRPPYFHVQSEYYRALFEERRAAGGTDRLRGDEAPHARAVTRAMKECGYTSRSTFQKHLQKANALDPELAELWKGHGAEWVRSE